MSRPPSAHGFLSAFFFFAATTTTTLGLLLLALIFRSSQHRTYSCKALSEACAECLESATTLELVGAQHLCRKRGLSGPNKACLRRAALHDGLCGSQTLSKVRALDISGDSPTGL
jgi:hypothetical protein